MPEGVDDKTEASPLMSPLHATFAVVLMVPVFLVYLMPAWGLGFSATYGGFVFLTYWAGFRGSESAEFLPSLIGVIGGIGICWMLAALPQIIGPWGYAPAALLILFSIFCLMCGWLKIVFNMGFMLMLTIGTIAPVAAADPFLDMVACTLWAGAYFGSIKLAADAFSRSRRRRAMLAG